MSIDQKALIKIITEVIHENPHLVPSEPTLNWYTEDGYFCLAMAKKLAKIAEVKAVEKNCAISIAIVDLSGNLVLYHRMPKSVTASVDYALHKAYTAAMYQWESGKMDELITPQSAMTALLNIDPKVTSLAGGFPITDRGKAIGGLGISGGSLEQDSAIAIDVLQTIKGANHESR